MAMVAGNLLSALLALMAGGLMTMSMAPISWWPCAVLSAASLFFICRGMTTSGVFGLCFMFGIGLFGVGASWVWFSIHDFGQASPALASLLTAVFILAIALIFALPLSLLGRLRNAGPLAALLGFTTLWVLGEWFRSWFLTGFPWLFAGSGFIDTPIAGWAPIGGVYLLSAIVIFTGGLLALLADREALPSVVRLGLPILATLLIGGQLLSTKQWTRPTGKALSIALVQPDLPLLEKWKPEQLSHIVQSFQNRNRGLVDRDLIIWPESSLPTFRSKIQALLTQQDREMQSAQSGLILGMPSDDADGRYYNALLGLGLASGEYHKTRLVPFGEYVPLENTLRGLINFFDLPMSGFSSGQRPQPPIIFKTQTTIAGTICYEIAYPDLVASAATDAHAILTVSNDTWFGNSFAAHQHLEIARMRALENQKTLLRATNDGLTAIVLPNGKVSAQLPRFEPGVLLGELITREGNTPFSRYGSLTIMVPCAAVLLTLLALQRARNQT